MLGLAVGEPQNESTPLHPRSTYGISKAAGYHLIQYYREAHRLHAASGILFNHESPRRGLEFVSRKITSAVARIKLGLARELRLRNLEAQRHGGHAREYVEAMWLMLQQGQPDDYVIATGETHSVREFLEVTFSYAGLEYREWVKLDPKLLRPAEVDRLVGEASKARRKLRWQDRISFRDSVAEMVEADLEFAREAQHGFQDERE